ncbi:rubrerythrin-like domain-containing protein [Halosolutus halophilus]|nr:rubrerythrin-like domain-containing protein [Halosolutus halophilus]
MSRRSYECEECAETVHPHTYRASCPECGGPLRTGQLS